MIKSLLLAATLGLLARPAHAIDSKTFEGYGIEVLYSSAATVTSSHTITGILSNYSVTAVGGTADFVIKYSTDSTAAVADLTVSSATTVLANQSFNNWMRAIVVNPIIYIKRIDAGTTVYVDMDYLAPRGPGLP